MKRTGPYNASDLPIFNNRVYHLDRGYEKIEKKLILLVQLFLVDKEINLIIIIMLILLKH